MEAIKIMSPVDWAWVFLLSSIGILILCASAWMIVQAATLKYQNETDRLWKTGLEIPEVETEEA